LFLNPAFRLAATVRHTCFAARQVYKQGGYR